MIRLENISKQNGHQILFIEASAALLKGEKVGLIGPNGAGKTTLFRMIAGEEVPDEGQAAVDQGVTIGYFSQDVGEMSGRSAVSEAMDGAGPVSLVAAELKELEAAMADPDQADDIEKIVERYGEVQGRFEELDGYALEGRAREVLAGLNFTEEMMDGDVGALSGGWKMRVALARILLMRPDAMLLDEPSNHLDLESLIWLEAFLKGYEGALLMTSHDRAFMNRVVTKVVEIDGGALTTFSGDYEFYEQQRAQNEKQQQAQFDRQQAMLAKEIKFIERFKARASHAAQVQSRVKKLDKIERVEPPRRRQEQCDPGVVVQARREGQQDVPRRRPEGQGMAGHDVAAKQQLNVDTGRTGCPVVRREPEKIKEGATRGRRFVREHGAVGEDSVRRRAVLELGGKALQLLRVPDVVLVAQEDHGTLRHRDGLFEGSDGAEPCPVPDEANLEGRSLAKRLDLVDRVVRRGVVDDHDLSRRLRLLTEALELAPKEPAAVVRRQADTRPRCHRASCRTARHLRPSRRPVRAAVRPAQGKLKGEPRR